VAEPGSVLLGDRLELGCAMANLVTYLRHWVRLLKGSRRVLLQVAIEASRAAELICPEITRN
jgi:hypothetical protein